ncbi:PHP domain-containing protein, partial [Pseudomonas chlororaphis]
MSGYAELHCLSNFSFQRGASSARELFERAAAQGYEALAITDECSLAGIVRAWQAAKESGLALIVGSEMRLDDGLRLVLLVENLEGYQNLCRLITQARRRAPKGQYRVLREDFAQPVPGLLALWRADGQPDAGEQDTGRWLRQVFADRLWLAVELHCGQDDDRRLAGLLALAREVGIAAVACGDVHMHVRGRRALQDP